MKRAPEGGLERSRTTRRTPAGLIALAVAGAIVAAGGPAAVAQTSTPSPKELWDSYPLAPQDGGAQPDPAPTPTPTASPTASPARATPTPAAAADDGTPTPVIVGGVVVAFAIGIGAGELWRRRMRAAQPVAAAVEPAPQRAERPAPPPTPAPKVRAPKPTPKAPAPKAAKARAPKPAAKAAKAQAPKPAPQAPAPRVQRPAEPPREWLEPEPPRPQLEPEAPRPQLEPEAPRPQLEPEAPRPQPEPPRPQPVRRFAPAGAWPDGADRQWTCEIAWRAGYRTSSFRAMVAPPGTTRRRAFGESSPIRWMLMDDPDPPTQELVELARELGDALEADGWQSAGRGRDWYALRFVWTHRDDPRPIEPLTRKAKHVSTDH